MAIQDNTVVRLPGKRRSPIPRPSRPTFGLQRWVAVGCAAVVTGLLILSLSHLAHGIVAITGAPFWEALLLAIGIDAGLVAAEASMLCAGTAALRAIKRWAVATISGTVLMSMLLNALAFAHGAAGPMLYAAIVFGASIPVLIYALCRISVGLVSSR